MNKFKKAVSAALMLSMLITVPACSQNTKAASEKKIAAANFKYYNVSACTENLSSTDKGILSSYRKTAENDLLSLYIDDNTSYIALAEKRSGKVWYAVSPSIAQDPKANDNSRALSMSTLSVTYIQSQSSKSMDNYSSSIQNKNFKIQDFSGGVEVNYTIGDPNMTINDIPQKLSDARYKKFFVDNPNLTDVDKVRTKKYYKFDNKGGYWQFAGDDSKVVYMADIMQRTNYTADDLEKDNAQFGIKTNSTRVFFKIPVRFYLQNESLMVDIPLKRVGYNKNSPPLKMDVLPNFGAVLNHDGGYMFVPDGSGALIEFSDQQQKTGTYVTRVYGTDMTIPVKQKLQADYKANMPVFGMKAGNSAFFAIVEDSDALASVNAVRAGTMNSYNTVYSSFTLSENQNVYLGDSAANAVAVMQKALYSGDVRIRYSFLSKEDSDYSGMARYYRSYLQSCYNLKAGGTGKYSINIELLGAVRKLKSFLGFSYNGIQKLTTFDQAADLLRNLKQQNIDAVNLQFTGWMNNGLSQYSAKKFNILGALGGKSGLERLNLCASENGDNLFYSVNTLSVPQDSKYFSKYFNAAKTLNNSIAQLYSYDTVTGQSVKWDYIVSTGYLNTVTDSIVQNGKNLKLNGIAAGDLGRKLYSDFSTQEEGNRQSALFAHTSSLEKLKNAFGGIMTDDANLYALPYEKIVVNAPLSSNNSNIVDESVPFYTMVLHGLVEYTGAPMNYSQDLVTDTLKLAETGAEPYFSLMYEDGSCVKDTDYSYLYDNSAGQWLCKAEKLYKQLKGCLENVQGRQILSREQVAENVIKVSYEGGSKIYVNYNKEPVKVDQLTISGDDFLFVKG